MQPKRRTSNSSTTTLDSDCQEENDSHSKASDDDDIEVIKTYPTRSRTTINNEEQQPISDPEESNAHQPWLDEMREQFWFPFLDMLPEDSQYDIELSGKFLLLKYILDKCAEIGDKIILFARSLYTLDHLEQFLIHLQNQNDKDYESEKQLRELLSSNADQESIPTEHIPEPMQWVRDRDYFRMDGQTEITARKRYVKAFNDTSNLRARLFLISTLAGGMGINLVGSNRVIVFDASWNPR
jgi:transcriptional regulator ATRX